MYRQFPSKAELLAEVFRCAAQREVDAVVTAAGVRGSAAERLCAAIETFARRALAGRRLAWALIAEPVEPEIDAERLVFRRAFCEVFAGVLSDGIAAGEVRAQRVGLSAAALVGAIGEALAGPLAPIASPIDPDALVGELVEFCLRSVTQETPQSRMARWSAGYQVPSEGGGRVGSQR